MGYSPWGHKESDMSEAVEPVHMHSISHTEPQSFDTNRKTRVALWVTDLNQHWLCWLCVGHQALAKEHRTQNGISCLARLSIPNGPYRSGLPGLPLFITEISSQYYSDNDFELFFFLGGPHCPAYGNLSSSTRGQTCAPAVEGQSPNHWPTREVPELFFCTRWCSKSFMETKAFHMNKQQQPHYSLWLFYCTNEDTGAQRS